MVLNPKTGRTHQLRVHMKHLGCPIAGDPVYGYKGDDTASLMLHAYTLRIQIPGSEEMRTFRAPLPERFKRKLSALGRAAATPRGDRG